MALTLLSDLVPYEQYIRTGYMEAIDYFLNIFNAGSRGTVLLESENTTGVKKNEAFWKSFGQISRRDITVQTDQTSAKIERDERTAFKTFWKFEPIEFTLTSFKTSDNMTTEEVMMMIGDQLAKRKLEYSVARALAIVCTAIGSNSTMVHDLATGGSNLTVGGVIDATAKFGDASGSLQALVMHSAVFFSLIKDQTVNYLFDSGAGMMIYGGSPATFGKPVIVTDNPELVEDVEGVNHYNTPFLATGAVTIADNGVTKALAQPIAGKENIASIFQAEGDMWNYVKGYQLKSTAGTNPTDAALGTTSNWEKTVTSDKNTAGVLIKSLANLSVTRAPLEVRVVS